MKFIVFFLLFFLIISNIQSINNKLAIVFVYTVSNCHKGLPNYIYHSLNQAVNSQSNSDVFLLSNFKRCKLKNNDTNLLSKNIIQIDYRDIKSNKTRHYLNISKGLFQRGVLNNHTDLSSLWETAANRFFYIEDFMINKDYNELLHIEADNMLYGDFYNILPILRSSYNGLAATPLTAVNKKGGYVHIKYITASIFWISNLNSIVEYNNYLIELAKKDEQSIFGHYIEWLRKHDSYKG